jgi:RHS repeat-associated protein
VKSIENRRPKASDNLPQNTIYYVKTKTLGAGNEILEPETVVYYDVLGREIRTEQMRFDGSRLKTDKQYDGRGRLWRVSLPHKSNSPAHWNVYSYDDYDRPTEILYASGKRDRWTYSENTITGSIEGVSSTKTFSAAGQLIKVTDAGGTITYSYRPDGQTERIVTNGVTTSFTYDDYGRQLTVNDPSAGTETVTYDAKGNIATQRDAGGNQTSFVYDNYNRLTQKQMTEYNVNYTYDGKGNLTGISSDGGRSVIAYAFDAYGRLTSEMEFFDNVRMEKRNIYSGDVLSAKQHLIQGQQTMTEALIYQNGYHIETRLNGSRSIWRIASENAMGQTTKALTGNLIRTYGFDNYGMPALRQIQSGSASVQFFAYTFEAATGNLRVRRDLVRGKEEVFRYDDLNRLTDTGSNSIGYYANGNIQAKSDFGSYEYNDAAKPYALSKLSKLSNNSAIFPNTQQRVTYTSFKRPQTIYYGDRAERVEFAYNGKNDRTMMKTAEKRIVYLNNCYEAETTGNTSREKLYLYGDYYTSPAVMVRENRGDWQLYCIGRDYLGSITHVIREDNRQVVQELSYDAWGNLRDPNTHVLYATDNQPVLSLGRGYTGHEHLTFCGLINMNARLYDPAVGRFLSPDPYVQDPANTQNYNRYSYVLNNPLKYTDPSGDKYTYNWRTGQYEDEYGDWATWKDVYSWMNNNYMFAKPSKSTNGAGTWDIGGFYQPGYLYFNTATGQIRYLMTNSLGGATLRTLNPTGNSRMLISRLEGIGLTDELGFLIGSTSTITTILGKNYLYNELWHKTKTRGISIALNKGKWNNPGAKNWRNVQTKPFQGIRNVGKGLSKGGVALVGVDVALSGEVKPSHIINVGMSFAGFSGVGSLIAGIWFAADFGTMGVNYLLGNGVIGLGDMLDNSSFGQKFSYEMYEGLY